MMWLIGVIMMVYGFTDLDRAQAFFSPENQSSAAAIIIGAIFVLWD